VLKFLSGDASANVVIKAPAFERTMRRDSAAVAALKKDHWEAVFLWECQCETWPAKLRTDQ